MKRSLHKSGGRLRDDWKRLRPRVTKKLLSDISDRIVRTFHPQKVILFGSYAYGRPHIYSDVDLFVIMASRESMVKRMIRVREVADVPFLPMDVLVYTPSEVRARRAIGDHFIEEILTRGKVLYQHG